MKVKGNILFSIMLSLMIVYLGVGIVVTHCHKDQTARIGMPDDCCMSEKECCLMNQCKDFTVMKLSPTTTIKQLKSDVTPDLHIINILCGFSFKPASWFYALQDTYKTISIQYPPPREYLNLIQVLRI